MSNMVVRTNVMSLNSHRNLGMTGTLQARSAARLSSGFRINSAADDAAGLAISEKMRSQIRGLDQASRNAQDGISLIQTAEGAMQTINEMVTRIRELVIQAANDTNAHEGENLPQSDRMQIQREINQLLEEIDQVTLRTEFNTRTLLDGSLAADPLRGIAFADVVSFMTDLVVAPALAELAARETEFEEGRLAFEQFTRNRELLQNLHNSAMAITQDTIIQRIHDLADGLDNLITPGMPPQDVMDVLEIVLGVDATDLAAAGADTDAFILAARNGTLTAADFVNIGNVVDDARDAYVRSNYASHLLGFSVAADVAAAVVAVPGAPGVATVLAADAITGNVPHLLGNTSDLADVAALLAGAYSAINAVDFAQSLTNREVNLTTSLNHVNNMIASDDVIGAQFSNLADLQTAIDRYMAGDIGNALWFQIGANRGQGIHLSIEAVNVGELNRVAAGHTATVDGFNIADLRNVALEDGVGVMHEHGSVIDQFVSALDAALAHVTGQRAHLGAVQNRLEFTIENLDTASENLSAANSRIRDADMAKEMMRFTQANVLQQAAISMLAQANMAPQNILQLLG